MVSFAEMGTRLMLPMDQKSQISLVTLLASVSTDWSALDIRFSVSLTVFQNRPKTLTVVLTCATWSSCAYTISWGLCETQLCRLLAFDISFQASV